MRFIPFIADLYKNAKKRNVLAGVLIIDIIAFICFLIFPYGFFYRGDIQMTIGSILGIRFALKHRKENHPSLVYGILVGLGGTFLTAISMTLFILMLSLQSGYNLSYLPAILFPFILVGILVGLVIGLIFGLYYHIKHEEPKEKSLIDDEFFDSLRENNNF